MEKKNLVLKLVGEKEDIQHFLDYLENKYFVFPTSSYIDNQDRPGVHRFVSVVFKGDAEAKKEVKT